jgi:hypothetical protein
MATETAGQKMGWRKSMQEQQQEQEEQEQELV